MKRLVLILFLICLPIHQSLAQRVQEGLKRQALTHMNHGRYGEAIDLLNKYVAANAQIGEGYNIRGLCHEKRGIYQFAVLDFRRAVRLEPDNPEYKKNLDRALRDWHQLLYQKIEGHERNIAIDPADPWNYLEIGKSYRWLEEWKIAEIWYDKYLSRDDDASPDEIIRYTEILSHTGSIKKGERILKIFVDRYPEDWRLWSRYGYFTMWLGNYAQAKTAFENALGFKPFFKEAQDGLDIAKNEGYLVKQSPRSFEREYPIDRFYRLLKSNPNDADARFQLIDELVAAERYEEAYDQLKILKEADYEGTERFDLLWQNVKSIRETVYTAEIDKYLALLKQDPTNKDAIIELSKYLVWLEKYDEADEILQEYSDLMPEDSEIILLRAKYLSWNKKYEEATELMIALLANDPFNEEVVAKASEYYANEYDYDKAIEIITNYLSRYPDDSHADLRFNLAKYHAWNYDWEDARDVLDNLIAQEPNNLDYQLLRAQVSVWTVDDTEFPQAEIYFNNYLSKDPTDLSALLGMTTIYSWKNELETARKYLDEAKKYHPNSPEIQTAENFYNSQLLVSDERKYAELRREGGELAQEGDCDGSILKYEEYFDKVKNPDRMAYKEYASALMCAQRFPDAISTYDRLLDEAYEYDVALSRAKAYLWSLDSTRALNEFEKLYEEDPENFEVRMFLGDAYVLNQNYGEAENLYYDLISETDDEDEIKLLNEKIDLIPAYGVRKGFNNFVNFILPYNISVIPSGDYYTDNQDLVYYNYGGRLEMGLMQYLSLGASFRRTNLKSNTQNQYLTGFMGNMYIHPFRNFSIGAGLGKLNIQGERSKRIGNFIARYDEEDKFGITFAYEDDDARRVLYSSNLVYERLDVYSYIFNTYYVYRESIKLQLNYRYNKVSDGNEGNDLRLRLGKLFKDFLFVGYEYSFSDYGLVTTLYYSPQEFTIHSLWAEWKAYERNNWEIEVSGRLGYAPSVDFVVSDIALDIKYELVKNLILQSRTTLGNSFRFDSSYRFFSQLFSMYWSFF